MKNNSLLLISLLMVINSISISAQSKYDIFPLKINNQYQYSYFFSYTDEYFGNVSLVYQDSGKVNYVIDDSIQINDSTILWNVSEQRYLYHKDNTVSLINDTIVIKLYEYLTGNHQIASYSDSWVLDAWYFPFISSDHKFYRYSDSSNTLIIRYSDYDLVGDTIMFVGGVGLIERSYYSSHAMVEVYKRALHVQLLNYTLSVVSNETPLKDFRLFQNYPNPFNPTTTIKYSLFQSGNIVLELYDCLGRKLQEVDKGFRPSGEHIVELNLNYLPSGIYFYKLCTDNYSATKKLVLLK